MQADELPEEQIENEGKTDRFFTKLKAFTPLFVLAIFALAAVATYRLFEGVHPDEIRSALGKISNGQVLLAALVTLINYIVLFGYDFSALAHLGKKIPKPVVCLTSFMAYGIGNTVGLSVLSGGAVRLRMYNRFGLDAGDVGVIALFTALSFGLGNAILALSANALVSSPLGVSEVQKSFVIRAVSIALVLALILGSYFLSARRSKIEIANFRFSMPSPSNLTFQIALAAADLLIAASVLYILFPAADRPEFLHLFFWFTIAIGIGVLSHVPGGAGVFEAVIAAGLAGQVQLADLAGALLLFRLVYYILPFLISLVLLLFSGKITGKSDKDGAKKTDAGASHNSVLTAVAAYALSRMTLFAGALLFIAAIIPFHFFASADIALKLPLFVLEAGSITASAAGMSLVVLSMALARHVRAAWVISTIVLLISLPVAFLILHSTLVTLVLAVTLILALAGRKAFHRSSRIEHWFLSPYFVAVAGGIVVLGAFALFFFHKDTAYSNELWITFAHGAHTARALRASGAALAILAVVGLFQLLRSPLGAVRLSDFGDRTQVADAIRGGENSNGGLALTGDKKLLWDRKENAFLMVQEHNRSLIAFDDPVGAAEGLESDFVETFLSVAEKTGRRPFFYEFGPAMLPYILDSGLQPFKIGEEAIVDLDTFTLAGKTGRGLRTTNNKAKRDGLEFALLSPPYSAELLTQLKAISDEWLTAKHGREKGFSVGSFAPDYLAHFPIAVVKFEGQIVAFANIMIAGGKKGTIDLMRHRRDAPVGTMEFMFTEIIVNLKEQNFEAFSLGIAPLSGLENARRKRLWEHVAVLVYRHGDRFYSFRGLRAFKQKFHPNWVPRYAAAASMLDFAAGLADTAALINRPEQKGPDDDRAMPIADISGEPA